MILTLIWFDIPLIVTQREWGRNVPITALCIEQLCGTWHTHTHRLIEEIILDMTILSIYIKKLYFFPINFSLQKIGKKNSFPQTYRHL